MKLHLWIKWHDFEVVLRTLFSLLHIETNFTAFQISDSHTCNYRLTRVYWGFLFGGGVEQLNLAISLRSCHLHFGEAQSCHQHLKIECASTSLFTVCGCQAHPPKERFCLHFCQKVAWVYPCCLARSKFRTARQPGGYDRFLSQEFVKIWYPITERGGTERRWRVLCDRRKLVVRSYGSNMAAAEAKLFVDLAVDSVIDSLELKFILKV